MSVVKKAHLYGEAYLLEDAVKMYPNALFIPTSLRRTDDQIRDLKEMHIPAESILIPRNLLDSEKKWQCHTRFEKKRHIPQLCVDVVGHCNLNCKGCSHFSPLVKNEFLDKDTFVSDFKRLSTLFGNRIDVINLYGGEPLLHPSIEDYVRIARQCFPVHSSPPPLIYTKIVIITNGLLIKNMKPSFWNTYRECDVTISVSQYPIHADYETLLDYIEQRGVQCEGNYSMVSSSNQFESSMIDLDGSQDNVKSFGRCGYANDCIALRYGKLYTCITAAIAADRLNGYFGTNIESHPDDGIDIYSTSSADDILEFLAKPIPFCRYCENESPRSFSWEISKCELQEWCAK